MSVPAIRSACLALALLAAGSDAALASFRGGRGAPAFRPGSGFRGPAGAFRGGFAGVGRFGGGRGLPPIGGVIHERAGLRPYASAYGHTDTAPRFGGYRGFGSPRYGHVGTGLRYGGYGRGGEARRRFIGYGLGGGYALGGYGLGGYGYGGGLYGEGYGGQGTYGAPGTYAAPGTYGSLGTYGGFGTTATQSVYGNGGFSSYRSERPLAARFAEPPLGPSPYAPYSPDDRYAYAASEDVRPAPRVLNPYGGARSGCACAPGSVPMVYRYGVGTAY